METILEYKVLITLSGQAQTRLGFWLRTTSLSSPTHCLLLKDQVKVSHSYLCTQLMLSR